MLSGRPPKGKNSTVREMLQAYLEHSRDGRIAACTDTAIFFLLHLLCIFMTMETRQMNGVALQVGSKPGIFFLR